MRIEIHNNAINLPLDLRKHAERRIQKALNRYAHRIKSVAVSLRDVNGPRGGVEYNCRIVVHLPPYARVVVTGNSAEALHLVSATAERAAFAVRRHLNRRRDVRRRPSRQHAAARMTPAPVAVGAA